MVGGVKLRTLFGDANGVVTEALVHVLRQAQVDALCELDELDELATLDATLLLLLEATDEELELAATDDELLDFTLDEALDATLEDATEETLEEELAAAGL